LAGGVRVAESPNEVVSVTRQILKLSIGDLPVNRVIIVRKVEVAQEYYLSIAVDGYYGIPVAILSLEGGVSINRIAQERPEVLVSRRISISKGFTSAKTTDSYLILLFAPNNWPSITSIITSMLICKMVVKLPFLHALTARADMVPTSPLTDQVYCDASSVTMLPKVSLVFADMV